MPSSTPPTRPCWEGAVWTAPFTAPQVPNSFMSAACSVGAKQEMQRSPGDIASEPATSFTRSARYGEAGRVESPSCLPLATDEVSRLPARTACVRSPFPVLALASTGTRSSSRQASLYQRCAKRLKTARFKRSPSAAFPKAIYTSTKQRSLSRPAPELRRWHPVQAPTRDQ